MMRAEGALGRPRKFCDVCRPSRQAGYYRYEPTPPKTKNCVVCGGVFRTKTNGRGPSACWLCRDQWRAEQRRAARNARRARERSVRGDVTGAFLVQLRKSQRDRCAQCSTELKGGGHLDHIVQLHLGGTHSKDNVRFLCVACNLCRPMDHSDVGQFQLNVFMQVNAPRVDVRTTRPTTCSECSGPLPAHRRKSGDIRCYECFPRFECLRVHVACSQCGQELTGSRKYHGSGMCSSCAPSRRVAPPPRFKQSYDGKHDMGTVVMLRRCGDGYKRIAKAIGVSRGTARELVRRAEQIGLVSA